MAEPEAPPKDDAEDTSPADEARADEEARGRAATDDAEPDPAPAKDEAAASDPPADDDVAARAAKSDPPTSGGGAAPESGERAEGPSWLPLAIAVALPVLFFFVLPPLTKSGIWDPYELNVADLARRIALNLHGAADLALDGADNSLPHLNDLGRPQLPFTSIALGFKLFGLHEWAGRAPLAVWGLIGVLATYGFVARLVDRRAGAFSAVALTTMPLYFVQARTMLGDVVMMAALAMSFGGLAVAVFGAKREDARDLVVRGAWLALAALGLVAGYYTRGSLIGVGVPALAVGAAYVVAVTNGQRLDALAHAAGGVAALVGASFAIRGGVALGADHFNDMTVPIAGALMKPPSKYPTFDFMIGHLAPGLAPWSAFIPFAIGRMFTTPTGVKPDAFARESQARLVLLVGAAVAFVAHGWMAGRADLVAFSAPAVMAAACGIALRDYERGAHPSLAVGVGTMVLLGLMHHELNKIPEKAFHAFSVASGATFPESFKTHSIAMWTLVLVGFAGIAFLTWVERDPEREPFEPKGYLRVLLALRDAWDGMLALAYFAMVAGASLAGLAVWIGTRQHAKWLPQLSSQMRDAVLNAWWVTAFAPLVAIFAVYFWCDVWVWAFDRAPRGRRGAARAAASLKAGLGRSATRGFEPFEELASRLKEGRLLETVPKLITGKLVVDHDKLDDGVGPVALFILAPLMYLQVPAILFLALWQKAGFRPLVAGALAIPSGVALFLLLGVVGDLFRGSRAAFLALFGATVSAVLCFSYYPALANQLSPKEIFESYQRTRKGTEPLALFGVGGRTAAYYAGGQPLILKDTPSAYEWLMGGDPGTRRFLAVRAEELSRLNRAYRERTANGENLPVLDARSSQIVLVASSLEGSEKNQNPLSRIVLTTPPKPQRKLEAVFEDKLEVLGYDIADQTGKLVDHVKPGKKYHMRTYFKVLAPMQSEWDMFIHVDGFRRRHNGDHKVCESKYPMSLWLKDDIVMDDHEFSLEPNFSPGAYNLWFGLFVGESRLKIKSGATDGDNRVNGGPLRVQ
ncbi:MAG: glycosyltransferase family 39 protein [Labilithrix sp.]|nr:glycosyltransferase family 39 protein [Labilithrix sp.]MBX3225098.1 glycosyltransferase family 39 protein [Labilithrix sp.]